MLLTISATLAVLISLSNGLPVQNDPQPGYDPKDSFCKDRRNGNYEYPAPHCDFFYSCSNSLTYVMACGEGGLYYDKRTDKCEWPSKFPKWKQDQCEGKTSQDVKEVTDLNAPVPGYHPNDSFCKDRRNGNYEYPAPHCDFFYSCSNSLTYVMACKEGGLYYHKRTNRCEWPSKFPKWKRGQCEGKTSQAVKEEVPDQDFPVPGYDPNDSFCKDRRNGNYEYPAPHCDFFYSCSNSLTYVMACAQGGLYYHKKTNRCEWPSKFPKWKREQCEGKTSEAVKEEVTDLDAPVPGYDPNDSFCKDRRNGNYEYPAPHCDFFYSCSNSLTYVMACGEKGLYYDKKTDRCEWPSKFPKWKQEQCEGNIGQAVKEEKDLSSGIVLDSENNDGPLPGYQPNDTFCLNKPNGNYEYPAPHCEFFYSCYDEHTYVLACAERYLYYDRKTNACDYPWRFPQWKQDECEGRVDQIGNEGSDIGGEIISDSKNNDGPRPGYHPNDSFCKDRRNGNYEYPAPHCDFFYSCSNSLTYVMACGEGGLYYDKSTDACQWPRMFPQWKRDQCEGKVGETTTIKEGSTTTTNKNSPPADTTTNPPDHKNPVPGYDPNDSFCKDRRNGNYEYPAPHCDFFYSCSNSLTYVMACGEGGLYYDKKTDACQWPRMFPQWKRDECERKDTPLPL